MSFLKCPHALRTVLVLASVDGHLGCSRRWAAVLNAALDVVFKGVSPGEEVLCSTSGGCDQ